MPKMAKTAHTYLFFNDHTTTLMRLPSKSISWTFPSRSKLRVPLLKSIFFLLIIFGLSSSHRKPDGSKLPEKVSLFVFPEIQTFFENTGCVCSIPVKVFFSASRKIMRDCFRGFRFIHRKFDSVKMPTHHLRPAVLEFQSHYFSELQTGLIS